MTRRLSPIWLDRRGATLVEFAFVAPVLCVLLIGAFDIAHTLYMQAVLEGVVQKTSRDSTLQSGAADEASAVLDGRVREQVLTLANSADVRMTRRFYRSFAEAAAREPEEFRDTDGDRRCDNGESFDDENHNGVWDADGGNAGQGGAKDATLYTVTVRYPRMFPFHTMIGGSPETVLEASTVLRNQPYADQGQYPPPVKGTCP